MKESNWSRVRSIIYNLLQDGQEHSYAELKDAIIAEDPALLMSQNTVNAVLYQMMKADPCCTRPKKAVYQYVKGLTMLPPPVSAYLDRLSEILSDLNRNLTRLSFELTPEEFSQQKEVYQLGKELTQLINKHR